MERKNIAPECYFYAHIYKNKKGEKMQKVDKISANLSSGCSWQPPWQL